MAVNNDQKTTILGVVKAVLYIVSGAAVQLFNIPIDTAATQGLSSAQDWMSVIMVTLGIVNGVIGYYTNKKDK